MTTKAAARELAERLQEQNESASWRAIADGYPRRPDGSQIVKAGTLCRIAQEGGDWLPKDREILAALGLIQKRVLSEHERRTRKKIDSMARKTKRAVLRK